MTGLATALAATDTERLAQAEALVRAYCGWHIAPSRSETVSVRAKGGRMLMLPSLYVTAVASVTLDDASVLTAEDEYVWSAAGVLTQGGCWGFGLVTIALTHGYTTAPLEVTAVVQALAQRAVDNPGARTSQSAGPFSESYSSAAAASGTALSLLASEKSVLAPYKIPVLA